MRSAALVMMLFLSSAAASESPYKPVDTVTDTGITIEVIEDPELFNISDDVFANAKAKREAEAKRHKEAEAIGLALGILGFILTILSFEAIAKSLDQSRLWKEDEDPI